VSWDGVNYSNYIHGSTGSIDPWGSHQFLITQIGPGYYSSMGTPFYIKDANGCIISGTGTTFGWQGADFYYLSYTTKNVLKTGQSTGQINNIQINPIDPSFSPGLGSSFPYPNKMFILSNSNSYNYSGAIKTSLKNLPVGTYTISLRYDDPMNPNISCGLGSSEFTIANAIGKDPKGPSVVINKDKVFQKPGSLTPTDGSGKKENPNGFFKCRECKKSWDTGKEQATCEGSHPKKQNPTEGRAKNVLVEPNTTTGNTGQNKPAPELFARCRTCNVLLDIRDLASHEKGCKPPVVVSTNPVSKVKKYK
jgi:hypothetical protein